MPLQADATLCWPGEGWREWTRRGRSAAAGPSTCRRSDGAWSGLRWRRLSADSPPLGLRAILISEPMQISAVATLGEAVRSATIPKALLRCTLTWGSSRDVEEDGRGAAVDVDLRPRFAAMRSSTGLHARWAMHRNDVRASSAACEFAAMLIPCRPGLHAQLTRLGLAVVRAKDISASPVYIMFWKVALDGGGEVVETVGEEEEVVLGLGRENVSTPSFFLAPPGVHGRRTRRGQGAVRARESVGGLIGLVDGMLPPERVACKFLASVGPLGSSVTRSQLCRSRDKVKLGELVNIFPTTDQPRLHGRISRRGSVAARARDPLCRHVASSSMSIGSRSKCRSRSAAAAAAEVKSPSNISVQLLPKKAKKSVNVPVPVMRMKPMQIGK